MQLENKNFNLFEDDSKYFIIITHIVFDSIMLEICTIPFFILLLSIAICPIVCHKIWDKVFVYFTFSLSAVVLCVYLFKFNDFVTPVLSFWEYVQFILLIVSLYIVSGGIEIKVNVKGSPLNNVLLLLCGGLCANFVGTTGASILFIMPFLKINKGRIHPYHIAFFIFIVCNIGGSLSPIGDPPLYLGFLKGIPFYWTLLHNFLPWITAITILLIIFYFIDSQNKDECTNSVVPTERLVTINGYKNFFWLAIIILSLFMNTNMISFLPCVTFHGHQVCFVRELLLLFICFFAYKTSDKRILKANSFSFSPIKELCVLFFGIFITMTPVITVVSQNVKGIDKGLITPTFLFWGTGLLSSLLDNAPTYLNMLTISMSADQFDINKALDVAKYASSFVLQVRSIAIAAIYFGSMTYLSNAPNFMIKIIGEQNGVKMPSFFGFVLKYSFVFLTPTFMITWYFFC